MNRWPTASTIAVLAWSLTSLAGAADQACTGHRVHHYVSDTELRRGWAILEDCEHPGAPWKAVELRDGEKGNRPLPVMSFRSEAPPEIVAGNHVRLWRRSGTALLDLNGVALESGKRGAPIRVRLDLVTGAPGKILAGIVRGPGSVELEPAAVNAKSGVSWSGTQ